MQTVIENLPLIITTLFGAGGTTAYFFERRKNKAEAISKEIDNKSNLIQVYREALDDLNSRCEKKYNEVTELYDRKIKALNEEIATHKRINTNLKKENTELTKQNAELRKQNAQLKRKNEELTIIIEKLENRIKELENNTAT